MESQEENERDSQSQGSPCSFSLFSFLALSVSYRNIQCASWTDILPLLEVSPAKETTIRLWNAKSQIHPAAAHVEMFPCTTTILHCEDRNKHQASAVLSLAPRSFQKGKGNKGATDQNNNGTGKRMDEKTTSTLHRETRQATQTGRASRACNAHHTGPDRRRDDTCIKG